MMKARLRLAFRFALIVLALPVSASAPSANDEQLITRYVVEKTFSDVIFELNIAITEHNFRITGRNSIGAGLRERGYQDFPDIEVIHFCSLEMAREVLIIDPAFVAQMPCRITVHEDAGKTVISLITLPTSHDDKRVNDFARRMNATLEEIVEFVLDTGGG